MQIEPMFRAEQEAMVVLAEGLTADEWATPSLCAGWTVRDVVVHVAFHTHRSGLRETIGSQERLTAKLASREHAESGAGLCQWLAAPAPAPARRSKINLCELVIHQQDVRRVLGKNRTYPETTLRTCLDLCRSRRGALLVCNQLRRATSGVELVATDIDWSAGRGPRASGTAEAILMAMAGRSEAVSELAGPGSQTIAGRVGADR